MGISHQQALDFFSKTEALLHGHFLLSSGKHSDTYFQCAKVLQHPDYTEKICSNITDHFFATEIDAVVAPAMGGIIVGFEVARQLGKRFIFTERENNAFALRRGFEIKQGEKVLVCEDVVTTGGSVFEVIDVVKAAGGIVVGVGYLVDRSNGTVSFGVKQAGTVSLEIKSFEPDECPLCKQGIPFVKPGSRKLL